MPLGEWMARSAATLCFRYSRYSKAKESKTPKQAIAIPKYLRIFLITSYTRRIASSIDTRGSRYLFLKPETGADDDPDAGTSVPPIPPESAVQSARSPLPPSALQREFS